MRDPRRTIGWVVFGAGLAAALAVAVGGYMAAGYAWNQVVEYRTPYVTASLPAARPGPQHTRRVVLVVVDGLTRATSEKMTALRTLREFGSDLTLTVSQPSLSFPGWTTILSGATPRYSGVTTNWWQGRVKVETLLDVALAAGDRTVVVGPSSFEKLYGANRATAHYYKDYDEEKPAYLSTSLVLRTIDLVKKTDPQLVILHLPDVDETAHRYGAASAQYLATALKVDTDLSVLVNNVQDGHTTFVVVSDHGHIAGGGHGGWESEVTRVPAVLAGAGIGLGTGSADQADLAPTVAAVAGLPVPRHSVGRVLASVLASSPPEMLAHASDQRLLMLANVYDVVRGWPAGDDLQIQARRLGALSDAQQQSSLQTADAARLAGEREGRESVALGIALLALAAVVAVGVASWRALVGALAGTAAYYLVYDGLFFGLHRLSWSLSVTNSEALLKTFFITRMVEAVLGGLVAAAAAALVYVALRREPKGAWGAFLPGWLSLGPATILVAQATLVSQLAWYVWAWGLSVTWIIPDLRAGFKADLDMLQLIGLGIAAVLSPLVTLLVGRYHPRVARGVVAPPTPTLRLADATDEAEADADAEE